MLSYFKFEFRNYLSIKQLFNRSVCIVERGKSKKNGRSTSPSKRDKKTSEWVNSAKKGSDIEAQLHVRTHLFHKLFFGVASPGVFRATHFLMVKVIHNDRVPRLCPAVGQLVVHEGTVVFFRQPFRLILQTTEVASVSLVVDSVVQRNQVRIFFTYIVKDVFFESASQV